MTTTTSTSAANLSLAQAAAQAALVNATTSTTGTSSSGSATSLTNPLVSLGQNFTDFLSLLTTQLKNQDPTSPMDTNQFTQELVQFTGVQQSVATNANLTQLISLTQGSEVLQSTAVVGKVVTATSPQLALQSGQGTITFNATAGQQVTVAIVNSAGQTVSQGTLTATVSGANTFVWKGAGSDGTTEPDGAYGVALETGSNGAAVPLAFSVIGTATGLANTSSGMVLDMGAVAVPLANVQSLNTATTTTGTTTTTGS
jgi:flagellar basal-body rod modification protein FlgD